MAPNREPRDQTSSDASKRGRQSPRHSDSRYDAYDSREYRSRRRSPSGPRDSSQQHDRSRQRDRSRDRSPIESGELRYELAKYVPEDGYFDCDTYYLVQDAGVTKEKSNCFQCGRPKTVCQGWPKCPDNVLCLFCGELCGNHETRSGVS